MNNRPLARLIMLACDLGLLYLSFLIAHCVTPLFSGQGLCILWLDSADPLLRVALFSGALWLLHAWQGGLYRLDNKHFWSSFLSGIQAMLKTVALVLVLLFLAKIDLAFPRPAALLASMIAIVLVPLSHAVLQSLILKSARNRTLLLGNSQGLEEFFQARQSDKLGQQLGLCGILKEHQQNDPSDTYPLPVFGETAELEKHVAQNNVNSLVICAAHISRERLHALLESVMGAVPRLLLYPDVAVMELADLQISNLGGRVVLDYNQNLHSAVNQLFKRTVDVLGSLCGLLLLAPLLVTVSLLIMLDSPGAPIYRHRRYGREKKWIYMIKFRSMVSNGDEALKEHLAKNPEARAEWESLCKLKDDPRITRIGKFLRRWSLDELPQIINVLMGDMSLVGPRPINDVEYDKYGVWQRNFMSVRPGLTGLWQVSGRSDIDFEDRVKLDMYYIRNWNIWMDFRIIMKTFKVVLFSEGAY